MRAITLTDGIQQVAVTTNAIVTLEEWGYDPFSAYTFRAIVKDVDALEVVDGKVNLTAADTSLSKLRDHLAAALGITREEAGARMLPDEWGNYLTAVLDLGDEFWGTGEDDDPKDDDSTSGE